MGCLVVFHCRGWNGFYWSFLIFSIFIQGLFRYSACLDADIIFTSCMNRVCKEHIPSPVLHKGCYPLESPEKHLCCIQCSQSLFVCWKCCLLMEWCLSDSRPTARWRCHQQNVHKTPPVFPSQLPWNLSRCHQSPPQCGDPSLCGLFLPVLASGTVDCPPGRKFRRESCTDCLPFLYCRFLSLYCCLPSLYCHLPSLYCCLPSLYCCLPSLYCHLPTLYCCLPTLYCCLPSLYCRLPSLYCRLPTLYCHLPPLYYCLPSLYCCLLSLYCHLPLFTAISPLFTAVSHLFTAVSSLFTAISPSLLLSPLSLLLSPLSLQLSPPLSPPPFFFTAVSPFFAVSLLFTAIWGKPLKALVVKKLILIHCITHLHHVKQWF